MQLYDLSVDPKEELNRYDQHPEVVKGLSDLLQKYQEEGRSVFLPDTSK